MLRLLPLLLALSAAIAQAAPQPPSVMGKSWLVVDLSSGQVLAAERPEERVEPASLTKIMTAYVVFAALRALADEGKVPAAKVAEAIKKYGINPEKANPHHA